ncbi:hypothetical protein DSO57_1019716 [Entomophthora muscae]|uniref:Uncharacterized protein n=1 Tax=Entomophthora muscae TaxID=34485 RepID=A0ACC2SGQ7_9FUNG|nr:hypothetical protein DSO57_1019716 [Entomophthora muscae]
MLHQISHIFYTKSNKNSQQPKRQASKSSKETASTPKHAKKPAKAKSPTPSPPTPSPPNTSCQGPRAPNSDPFKL